MAVYRDSYDIRGGKIPLYRSMNAIKNFIVPKEVGRMGCYIVSSLVKQAV
jgi:hypothetical protein